MTNQPAVWIIDDDTDDLFLIELAFKSVLPSVSLTLLEDGDDLLLRLEKTSVLPRLVLLDINMSRKNGFEALEEIRSRTAFRLLPVVMLTTSCSVHDRERALALGANGFLTKPLTIPRIIQMLQTLALEWHLYS
ncbi:response regulator [Fibrella arboris]|uniref:response regulator n=1 Tax=Fibrella arboris TaxID=3242486 RepID=UPI003520FA29